MLIGQTNGEARCSGFEDVVKEAAMTVVASVSQHPELMAKNGVEAAIKIIKGEKVDAVISTKIEIVTKK